MTGKGGNTRPSPLAASALSLLAGTAAFSALALLFGAPLDLRFLPGTLLWASLVSSCTVLLPSLILGFDWDQWSRLLIDLQPCSRWEALAAWLFHGSLIGTWLGAFVIPLDWDKPWQVWPRSCVVGLVCGSVCSLVGHQVAYRWGKTRGK